GYRCDLSRRDSCRRETRDFEIGDLLLIGSGGWRGSRRDLQGAVVPGDSLSARRTRSDVRLGYEKGWVRYLDRADIARRDDHAGTAFGEPPQANGKVFLQADTAVRGRVSRDNTRVQRYPRPGDALHIWHRGAAVEIRSVPSLFADDAEYAKRRRMTSDTC